MLVTPKKKEKSNEASWESFVFTHEEKGLINPIIDSAAGSSLIDIDTLKKYAEIKKINAENLTRYEQLMITDRFWQLWRRSQINLFCGYTPSSQRSSRD